MLYSFIVGVYCMGQYIILRNLDCLLKKLKHIFFFLVSCLSCYQCNSRVDSDCIEDFDHDNQDTLTIKSEECRVDAAEFCVKTTGVWGGKY